MEKYTKLWRAFFLFCMTALAVQQLIWGDFRSVVMPPAYPAWLVPRLAWTWVFSIALIIGCIGIFFETKARSLSLVIAAVFLLLIVVFQIPGQPYPGHIGSWTDAFKELTFSGGFFVIAGTFPAKKDAPGFTDSLAKLIPLGKHFLAVTMVVFGFMHFVYPDFVATLVPNWIPWHLFWTYFGGVALMLSGIAIIINVQRRLAAALLGLMLFIWFIILHIPRGIADPYSLNGNEWSSVYESLGFSGIAFIITGSSTKKA